ncbi:UNVERIFIED_CONTAM: pentapeptide repeat-containing protein, partial [Salmonella enterica subsp. enterica serovar Weltevreden]
AQGADFRGANVMNMVATRSWCCSAYMSETNRGDANFSRVIVEKCELWENRWKGTVITGAVLRGSDLSCGEFSSVAWSLAALTGC